MSEPRDVLIRHAGRRRVQGGAVSIGRAGRGRTECRHWSEGGRWIRSGGLVGGLRRQSLRAGMSCSSERRRVSPK